MLDAHRAEVASLLAARSQAEADYLERLLAASASYQAQLEELRVADGEDYSLLKIK